MVSTQINYPGCSNGDLASRLAMRDLKALTMPLVKVNITVNRHAYHLRPGDTFSWDWPDLGIENMVLRVVRIEYGELLNGAITINAVQDVFSLPAAIYSIPPPTDWEDPIKEPKTIKHQRVIEAPYFLLAKNADVIDPEKSRLLTLAAIPTGDSLSYQVMVRQRSNAYSLSADVGLFTPSAVLDKNYPEDTDYHDKSGQLILTDGVDLGFIRSAAYNDVIDDAVNLALLGDEFIAFTDITRNDDGTFTLNGVLRGLLDTIPTAHKASDRIWFVFYGHGYLEDEYSSNDRVDLKYLPVTSKGVLDLQKAVKLEIEISERSKRPYPPGNLKVNGQRKPGRIIDDIVISWAHRNRLIQGKLVKQDDSSVKPEAGASYTVKIYGNGILKHEVKDVTDSRYVYDQVTEKADNGGKLNRRYRVEVESVNSNGISMLIWTINFSR